MSDELVRLRLDLAYDGTRFAGWARQPGLRTVQGELEQGLATVLRCAYRDEAPPRVTVAGRTDSGVHARGQVAHVDVTAAALDAARGRDGRPAVAALAGHLAGVLDDDLVVRGIRVAPAGFDARFAALRRRYAYRVCDDPARRDPLRRAHVLAHRRPLDADAMDRAAAALVGLHDFAAFCRPRPGATTVRTLEEFGWRRVQDGADAGLVVARVVADAFCHSQVRAMVGACLAVGEGRRDEGWPAALLAARRRDGAAVVAPALGLTLEEVQYPPDDELVTRTERTRARRESIVAPGGCCG